MGLYPSRQLRVSPYFIISFFGAVDGAYYYFLHILDNVTTHAIPDKKRQHNHHKGPAENMAKVSNIASERKS